MKFLIFVFFGFMKNLVLCQTRLCGHMLIFQGRLVGSFSRWHDHLVCHAGSLERKVSVKSIIQSEYNL